MRDYGKIYINIWGSRKFKALKSDDARLLYFYLHTCPHVNSVGCFVLRRGYAIDDLGWSIERYQSAIVALQIALLIGYDEGEQIIRIVDFLKHDPFTNRKHAAGALKLAVSLPESPEKAFLFNDISNQKFTDGLQIAHSPQIGLSHGYRTPEPEPEPKKKEEEDAQAREIEIGELAREDRFSPGFIADLLSAVGVTDRGPWWSSPGVEVHVAGWVDTLGLTEEQILSAAKASRTKHPEPPNGPVALDRWMEHVARGLAGAGKVKAPTSKPAAAPSSPEERLKHFADLVNSNELTNTISSMVSNMMRDALLHAGLVTPDRMRERGIY